MANTLKIRGECQVFFFSRRLLSSRSFRTSVSLSNASRANRKRVRDNRNRSKRVFLLEIISKRILGVSVANAYGVLWYFLNLHSGIRMTIFYEQNKKKFIRNYQFILTLRVMSEVVFDTIKYRRNCENFEIFHETHSC